MRRERPVFGETRTVAVVRCSSAILLVLWEFCHAHLRKGQNFGVTQDEGTCLKQQRIVAWVGRGVRAQKMLCRSEETLKQLGLRYVLTRTAMLRHLRESPTPRRSSPKDADFRAQS